jgi:hypothetical protein
MNAPALNLLDSNEIKAQKVEGHASKTRCVERSPRAIDEHEIGQQ